MKPKLTLYTRKDCCLCDEMKTVVREVAGRIPLEIVEVDVDGSPDLCDKFGGDVPLLFINGRKAFKYRVTSAEIEKRLGKLTSPFRSWLTRKTF
jgi:glutaredoxin